jgi:glycosyltransferase involved in cell wall biosynthesis
MPDNAISDVLILLALSVVAVAALRRAQLPPILGYLFVGVVAGPHMLGWIADSAAIHLLGEAGGVFLLSVELFTLAVLLVALASSSITHAVGLSAELGAFIAGMLIADTEYRHHVELEIRPFRDVLMGLFFITVGMQLDLLALPAILHWVLLLVFVARFAREKRVYELIGAVRRLGRPYHLLLVGPDMPGYSGPRITVSSSYLSHGQVSRLMASADAFVHAGDLEAFGLVVWLATLENALEPRRPAQLRWTCDLCPAAATPWTARGPYRRSCRHAVSGRRAR